MQKLILLGAVLTLALHPVHLDKVQVDGVYASGSTGISAKQEGDEEGGQVLASYKYVGIDNKEYKVKYVTDEDSQPQGVDITTSPALVEPIQETPIEYPAHPQPNPPTYSDLVGLGGLHRGLAGGLLG